MNPVVIIIPMALIVSGFAAFALVPLSLPVRLGVLAADLAAAAVVGFVLWRRQRR